MQESNELDGLKDIVLDDKDGSTNRNKLRKILVSIAVLVIIFLIVIFIMKMLNSDQDKNTNEARVIIPPEIETKTAPNDGDKIFEQVPIIKEDANKQSFEDIVKNLKEKEEKRQQEINELNRQNENLEPTQISPSIQAEPKKEITPKKPEPKKEVVVKKPQVKPKQTSSVNKPALQSGSIKPGAYIQVLSVSNVDENNAFFKNLKQKGYSFNEYKTTVNGKNTIKILIGPYSENKLNDAIKEIRKDINKNAFVFRVK